LLTRRARRTIAGVALVIVVAAIAVFVVAPPWVEKSFNHTLHPPPYAASERARRLHQKLTIVDLHADTLLWDRDILDRGTRGHVDVPRLIEGNVALQAFTIVTKTPRHQNIDSNASDTDNITLLGVVEAWPLRTWGSLVERALYQASKLDDAARRSGGKLTVIRTVTDLRAYLERRAQDPDVTAGFLGVEGAHALEGDLANLDRLFDAGIRMMAPTHFTDNDIGGSASGVEKIGLTDKGRELVRRMEAKGMLVDLAHASARTIDDVLVIATRPVVVSHTGVRGTCDNARNLSDGQLRGIAATGGVIGIGYWAHAVCVVDPASIARAIRHAVDVAGLEHVALGSDFDGTTTTPFDASGLVQLTDALLAAGFGDSEIRAIMGGNALRVLEQVLPPQ
jgi:membrane dipeptidase